MEKQPKNELDLNALREKALKEKADSLSVETPVENREELDEEDKRPGPDLGKLRDTLNSNEDKD
jgi:hypothetical protein